MQLQLIQTVILEQALSVISFVLISIAPDTISSFISAPSLNLDPSDPVNVYGIASVIFWLLLIVVSMKYVGVIILADFNGEGGIFAELALLADSIPTSLFWVS